MCLLGFALSANKKAYWRAAVSAATRRADFLPLNRTYRSTDGGLPQKIVQSLDDMSLLKGICHSNQIEDIHNTITIDIWSILTKGICYGNQVKNVYHSVAIDIRRKRGF